MPSCVLVDTRILTLSVYIESDPRRLTLSFRGVPCVFWLPKRSPEERRRGTLLSHNVPRISTYEKTRGWGSYGYLTSELVRKLADALCVLSGHPGPRKFLSHPLGGESPALGGFVAMFVDMT
jgi:hypothetical protein